MSNYTLVAINDGHNVLDKLRSSEGGHLIIQALHNYQLGGFKYFPRAPDQDDNSIHIGPPNPYPAPTPIVADDMVIGEILGSYYDRNAPGSDLVPVKTPPHSLVFAYCNSESFDATVSDEQIAELTRHFMEGRTDADSIIAHIYNDIVDREKEEAGESLARALGFMVPIFYNNAPDVFDLGVHKTRTFLPADAHLFRNGQGDNMYVLPSGHMDPKHAIDTGKPPSRPQLVIPGL